MTVENLIKKLQEFPLQTKVCLFDHRKNLSEEMGEFNSEGVYGEYEVSLYKLEPEEVVYIKEQEDIEFVEWVAISFDNVDYDDEGKCLLNDE